MCRLAPPGPGVLLWTGAVAACYSGRPTAVSVFPFQQRRAILQHFFGLTQVFQYIHHQNLVECSAAERRQFRIEAVLQVRLNVVVETTLPLCFR